MHLTRITLLSIALAGVGLAVLAAPCKADSKAFPPAGPAGAPAPPDAALAALRLAATDATADDAPALPSQKAEQPAMPSTDEEGIPLLEGRKSPEPFVPPAAKDPGGSTRRGDNATSRATGAVPQTKDDQAYYEPLIRIGEAKSPNVIYFLWGSDEASRAIYKTFIHPVVGKRATPARAIINLVQIVGSDKFGARDPGSLLFCAEDHRGYAALALGYLMSGGDLARTFRGDGPASKEFVLNEDISATLHSGGIALGRCLNRDSFYRQLYYASVKEAFFLKEMELANQPALILNGKKLDLGRKSDVRRYWKQVGS